jgi:lysophospholipase L1-like esterase
MFRSNQFTIAIATLLATAACGIRPTAKVAAYGDSITWGYGGLPGGWVDILQQASGYEISNLAIPGETAAGGTNRIDRALVTVPGATVLLLMHGGNDWVDTFRGRNCRSGCTPDTVEDRYLAVGAELRKMRQRAKSFDKRVVFATYWPSNSVACGNYTESAFALYQQHLERLNTEARNIAAELGDPVVDLYLVKELAEKPSNYHDCLHPSREGYAIIAQRWLEEISKWEP